MNDIRTTFNDFHSIIPDDRCLSSLCIFEIHKVYFNTMYSSSLEEEASVVKQKKIKISFHLPLFCKILEFVHILFNNNRQPDRIEQNNNPKQNNTHVPRPKITCQVIPIRTVPVLQPYITSNQFIEFKKKRNASGLST